MLGSSGNVLANRSYAACETLNRTSGQVATALSFWVQVGSRVGPVQHSRSLRMLPDASTRIMSLPLDRKSQTRNPLQSLSVEERELPASESKPGRLSFSCKKNLGSFYETMLSP